MPYKEYKVVVPEDYNKAKIMNIKKDRAEMFVDNLAGRARMTKTLRVGNKTLRGSELIKEE